MRLPSRAQFRALVAVTVAIHLTLLAIVELRLVSYPHDIEIARAWNHYGAMFPFRIVMGWSVGYTILFLAGQVGLLFFRPFARWLLAATLIAVILLDPFMGLHVLTPLEHSMAGLVSLFACLTLAMAIFSPLSAEFRK